MRIRWLHTRLAALVLLLLGVTLSSARADVSFLGLRAGPTTGAVAVGWTADGVPDSTLDDFGLSSGATYAGQSFASTASHVLSAFGAYIEANASVTLAAAGPCGRDAPVASAYVGVTDITSEPSPAHFTRADLPLVLRYTANQPVIYWAFIRWDKTDVLYPGPEGELVQTFPAGANVNLPMFNGYLAGYGMAGSAPNTGELDLTTFVRTIHPEGEGSTWGYFEQTRVYIGATSLASLITGVEGPATPTRVALAAPRPNPARGGTMLAVELPAPAHATLEILDVAGRHVRTLLDGALPAGVASVRWNGDDASGALVGAGIYFARLVAGRETHVRKIALTQ